jgi:hypothetical protein
LFRNKKISHQENKEEIRSTLGLLIVNKALELTHFFRIRISLPKPPFPEFSQNGENLVHPQKKSACNNPLLRFTQTKHQHIMTGNRDLVFTIRFSYFFMFPDIADRIDSVKKTEMAPVDPLRIGFCSRIEKTHDPIAFAEFLYPNLLGWVSHILIRLFPQRVLIDRNRFFVGQDFKDLVVISRRSFPAINGAANIHQRLK